MRTEQDLRAALTVRENLTPTPDTVLADVRHMAAHQRRRRTIGTVAAVILAVSAVVAVPVLLVQRSPAAPDPAPPGNPSMAAAPSSTTTSVDPSTPRPPFAFTIEPLSVAGFDILPNSVNADQQSATIWDVRRAQAVAALVVYPPGSPTGGTVDNLAPVGAEPVRVNGASGWYKANNQDALGWEYTPGGLAIVVIQDDASPLAKNILLDLAEGVRFVAPYPAKVPYRLGYLPSDLTPFNIVQNTGPDSGERSVVQLESRDENPPASWISPLWRVRRAQHSGSATQTGTGNQPRSRAGPGAVPTSSTAAGARSTLASSL